MAGISPPNMSLAKGHYHKVGAWRSYKLHEANSVRRASLILTLSHAFICDTVYRLCQHNVTQMTALETNFVAFYLLEILQLEILLLGNQRMSPRCQWSWKLTMTLSPMPRLRVLLGLHSRLILGSLLYKLLHPSQPGPESDMSMMADTGIRVYTNIDVDCVSPKVKMNKNVLGYMYDNCSIYRGK